MNLQRDMLAEYANNDATKSADFETWEAKKLKILAVFKP